MSAKPSNSPAPDVTVETSLERSVWWKIYFFIIIILSGSEMLFYISSEGTGIAEYINLVFLVAATIGLFGFTFLKRILFPKFWLIFLVVYVVFGFVYLFITNVDLKMGMSDGLFYGTIAFEVLISLPGYYALYVYGKNNNPIWKGT